MTTKHCCCARSHRALWLSGRRLFDLSFSAGEEARPRVRGEWWGQERARAGELSPLASREGRGRPNKKKKQKERFTKKNIIIIKNEINRKKVIIKNEINRNKKRSEVKRAARVWRRRAPIVHVARTSGFCGPSLAGARLSTVEKGLWGPRFAAAAPGRCTNRFSLLFPSDARVGARALARKPPRALPAEGEN